MTFFKFQEIISVTCLSCGCDCFFFPFLDLRVNVFWEIIFQIPLSENVFVVFRVLVAVVAQRHPVVTHSSPQVISAK
jgi:hypothetical protein